MELSPSKWQAYSELMRIRRPIGTLLLLWPTLMALWIASAGEPDIRLFFIFCLGTFLMRSAGCVINDYADRNFDGSVERTAQRPLASGAVGSREALLLFGTLCLAAFILVLQTNTLTVLYAFGAIAVASLYPFMKRVTQLPQLVLGIAFSFGIPMAFAAQTESIPAAVIWLVIANVCWTMAYDTFYAMVDREDDLKIGLKSTAILFGDYDRAITAILQLATLLALFIAAREFDLGPAFFIGLALSAALMAYQQLLIRHRDRDLCFKAFLHNNRVGACWFAAVAINYLLQ